MHTRPVKPNKLIGKLKSVTTDKFRKAFAKVPHNIQEKHGRITSYGNPIIIIPAFISNKFINNNPYIR